MENNYTNYNIKKNDIDDFKINPKAEDIEKIIMYIYLHLNIY